MKKKNIKEAFTVNDIYRSSKRLLKQIVCSMIILGNKLPSINGMSFGVKST